MAAPRASSIASKFPRTALTGILITGDQSKLSDIEKENLGKLITQLNEVPDNNPKDIHFIFMNFYLLDGYIPQKSRKKAPLGLGHTPVKGNLLQYLEDSVGKFYPLTKHTMFKAVPKAGKSDSHLENVLFASIDQSNPSCSVENANKIIENLLNKTFDNLLYEKQNEFVNCIKALVRTGKLDVWDRVVEEKSKLNSDVKNLKSEHLKNISETDIEKLYRDLVNSGVAKNLQNSEMRRASVVKIHPGGNG